MRKDKKMGDQFLHRYWEYLAHIWKYDSETEEEDLTKEEGMEMMDFQFSARRAGYLLQPEEYDEEKAWQNIHERIRKNRTLKWIRMVKYVAIVAIAGGCGLLSWYFIDTATSPSIIQAENSLNDYSGGIELILANGEKISPEKLAENTIFQGKVQLDIDTSGKSLNYSSVISSDTAVQYNTLRIPTGAEYSLKLPDGTVVRLNSESSLRFPLGFSGQARHVFLEGEAYFKVAKDTTAPFHVHAGATDVTVLGTEFNVSAYPEDTFWHTTLVNGSVLVDNGQSEALLRPSQQFLLNRSTGKVEVQKVDVSLYTSWVDGIIAFKSERLETIIQKLQRWYSFELFYQNEELKDMKFGGMINKNNPFEVVLKKLERTTNIRFEIEGHTVIAKKIQY